MIYNTLSYKKALSFSDLKTKVLCNCGKNPGFHETKNNCTK